MAKAKDVANFFIDAAHKCDAEAMTNLRLQKLMYFAQAWCIVRNGQPLFDEPIKAWEYGPVVPPIYKKYRICGSNPIAGTDDDFDYSAFSEKELSVLIDVFVEYGKYTTSQLVSMTHKPGGAWSKTIQRETIPHDYMIAELCNSKEPLKSIADLVAELPEAEWEA